MKILMNVVQVLQILSALIMIGLILIQHGKGADMGASFGGGSSGNLFGATGGANFLSRCTAICATVFLLCTLGLAYTGGAARIATTGQAQSVFENTAAPAASAPAAIPKSDTGAIPLTSESGKAAESSSAAVPTTKPVASDGKSTQ